jgi:hypothetical protein
MENEDHLGNCDACPREDTPVQLFTSSIKQGSKFIDGKLCRVCRKMSDYQEHPRYFAARDIWILFDLLQEGSNAETLEEES